MNIKIMSYDKINEEITDVFIKLVNEKPCCVLGLATGSSVLGVYKNLIKANKDKVVTFKDVTTFNLDEYANIDELHNQSYHYFMNKNFFNYIDINKKNTHVPCGIGDLEINSNLYEEKLYEAGIIDLQILGIGSNGHIAFNEPGTSFNSYTHGVSLDEQTRQDNSRFFKSLEEVPTQAITMGLASIMKAKKIILIALGKNKAKAIKELIEGDQTEMIPASILKNHPDCAIYVDEEASSLLDKSKL